MAISFNSVPPANRTPFTFVEFDNAGANQGPTLKKYRAVLFGQKLAAGTAVANTLLRITSVAQARLAAGAGSMLAHMFELWFKANPLTEVFMMPLTDDGAGVAATSTLTFAGTATAAGTISLYVAGRPIRVGVSLGDTAAAIATALAAAINANSDYPVTAAAVGAVVTLTYKHKGTAGNGVDVRLNYYNDAELLPVGITCAVVGMANGATDPSLVAAISNLGETQFDVIGHPYTGAQSLTALENELADRWGPIRQNDGRAITFKSETLNNLATLGGTRNSPHSLIFGGEKFPSAPYEIAASLAGVTAYYLNIDPARPLQTLPLPGILPPADGDRFLMAENNTLLFSGIATLFVDDGGVVRIQRAITTYRKSPLGADDPSYLDITTLATLSYLRYDFRTFWMNKYPRHKLANDGTRFGAGQAVMTPKIGKAEAISKFRDWEELGLVEGFDQFKNSLIVERNISDPNRLDFFMAPDLMNALVVTGVKIGFLL